MGPGQRRLPRPTGVAEAVPTLKTAPTSGKQRPPLTARTPTLAPLQVRGALATDPQAARRHPSTTVTSKYHRVVGRLVCAQRSSAGVRSYPWLRTARPTNQAEVRQQMTGSNLRRCRTRPEIQGRLGGHALCKSGRRERAAFRERRVHAQLGKRVQVGRWNQMK